ncbi:MAG: glycine--tRNA ligase, partial [Ezakiella massiliensis]
PGTDDEWFDYWRSFCKDWLLSLGMREDMMRLRDHDPEELSFYSKATTDIEYLFPFGWGELWGIANRTNYDLSKHMECSGEDMNYMDPQTNEKYIPYVVEPSLGADRVTLAFLADAYREEELEDGTTRTVLKFHPRIAPYKLAILPLTKKLSDKAEEVYKEMFKYFDCDYDERGSIGKRYRREDEIGTPFCLTIDFDTLEDDTVTLRDRDTMEQIRIKISEVREYVEERMMF